MSDCLPCGQTGCSTPCQPESYALDAVRTRFAREAVQGVCDTGRYRCPYWAWGQGPPLVFLHGLADSADAYLPTAARLTCGFRCIAYTLPSGRGDSARLAGYAHEQMVDDLFALLDHLHMDQTAVLGSSFGSTIALAAMHRRPERISRGILAAGFALRRLAPAERMLASLARWWPGSMRVLPLRAALSQHVFGPLWNQVPDLWQYFLHVSGELPIAAVARRALQVQQLDLRPILPEIRQPVLLICGEADPVINRASEPDLLSKLPNVQQVELVDCAHLAHYSHPDVFAAVIRQFLTAGQAAATGASACPAPCTKA